MSIRLILEVLEEIASTKTWGRNIKLTRFTFYHYTDADKVSISTRKNRFIPNSISCGLNAEGSAFGKNKFAITVDKSSKVLEFDLGLQEWEDLPGNTVLEGGKYLADYARKNNYDILKIKHIPGVGTEFDILNRKVIKKIEKINRF